MSRAISSSDRILIAIARFAGQFQNVLRQKNLALPGAWKSDFGGGEIWGIRVKGKDDLAILLTGHQQ